MTVMNVTVGLERQHTHDGLHYRHTKQAHRWLASEVRATPHLRLCAIFTLSHTHIYTQAAAVSCLDTHVLRPQT